MRWKQIEVPSEHDQQRFWSHVDKSHSCWIWNGAQNGNGYGTFQIDRKNYRVHRLSYMILRGEIPSGLSLDHLCRNRLCVNPDHLEAVSLRENILRGTGPASSCRTNICCHGHDLITNGRIRGDGKRVCILCVRSQSQVRNKAYRERLKAGV
jgi:hypothetical protein